MWVPENEVGPIGRWTRRPTTINFSSKIILATKPDRAIDLSCRACGAGAWALGLDSRWGSPLRSVFHPQFDGLVPRTGVGAQASHFVGLASYSEHAMFILW